MHEWVSVAVEVANQSKRQCGYHTSPDQEVIAPDARHSPESSVVGSDVDLEDSQRKEG